MTPLIEVYTFEDEHGTQDTFMTFDAGEAREYARKYSLKWLANAYQWVESEVVQDYTP
jgi:hypothetical protein